MSSFENMFKPKNVAVYDPIISSSQRKYFGVLKGGVETTERTFTTTTFSASSTQFSVPPPNPSTYVSRRVMLKQPVRVTITGQNSNESYIWQSTTQAFRQAPLASVMQTLDITLNGQSVSLQMNDVIKPLLLYHNNERDLNEREMSLSPMLRDQSQQYTDLALPNSSNRNPLEGFATAQPRGSQGRNAFPLDVTFVSKDEVIIDAELTEELYLSPLLFGGVRDEGFIGLQKFELNISWDPNIDRIWSRAPIAGIESNYNIVVEFKAPSLLFRYVTPPLNFIMPPFMQYSYNEIQRYPTNIGTLEYDDVVNVVSNNIQLNSIPRYMYLFCRKSNSSLTYNDSDCYASIEALQINWNNQNSLLSNATQQQLYDICRKNGVDAAWNEWSGLPTWTSLGEDTNKIHGIGSVMCLEFGTDIGLREDEAPGMIGTYNLQVQMDIRSRLNDETDYTFYIITVIPGIFTIYQNSASKRIGILNKNEVLMAGRQTGFNYYDLEKGLKSGGFQKKSR